MEIILINIVAGLNILFSNEKILKILIKHCSKSQVEMSFLKANSICNYKNMSFFGEPTSPFLVSLH